MSDKTLIVASQRKPNAIYIYLLIIYSIFSMDFSMQL